MKVKVDIWSSIPIVNNKNKSASWTSPVLFEYQFSLSIIYFAFLLIQKSLPGERGKGGNMEIGDNSPPANDTHSVKVALGVCFALKSWKEYLLHFTNLITLGKVVTFPLVTTFKTNRPPNHLFVNRIPN